MPAYYLVDGAIIRIADGAHLPVDPDNPDYQRYLADVAAHPHDPAYVAQGYDPSAALAALQLSARAAIDAAAEATRLRYITPGAGQAQTYQMKLEQAQAYLLAGSPENASAWPFIAGEAEALSVTPAAAAQAIIDTRDQWVAVGALIEKNRLAGKRAVTVATTTDAVMTARAAAIQQLQSL